MEKPTHSLCERLGQLLGNPFGGGVSFRQGSIGISTSTPTPTPTAEPSPTPTSTSSPTPLPLDARLRGHDGGGRGNDVNVQGNAVEISHTVGISPAVGDYMAYVMALPYYYSCNRGPEEPDMVLTFYPDAEGSEREPQSTTGDQVG